MNLPTKFSLTTAMRRAGVSCKIRVYDTLDSTNAQARRMIEKGKIKGSKPFLLLAHTQTAGRGRLGRSFYSPEGSGLYFTLVFRYRPLPCSYLYRVTPAAAVAVAMAVERVVGRKPGIKWVNDLYLDGKKVCGILTETVPSADGQDLFVIVGIGINVTTADFPQNLRHPAGCIFSPDAQVGRKQLSEVVALAVTGVLQLVDCPTECWELYQSRFMLTGQTVTYTYVCEPDVPSDGEAAAPCRTVTGVVEGVTHSYDLRLRLTDGTLLTLGSGEVTT